MVLSRGARGFARRAALGALAAAPLAGALALARRARAPVVGASGFVDSRIEGNAFPKRLYDPTGEPRLLPAKPARIISTFLAGEEILASLVPPERVVGVSVFADDAATSNCAGFYPPDVARVRAEPERLLALRADLVCVAGYTDIEAMRLLAGARLMLLRWSRFDSFAEVLAAVRLIGAAVGEEARAEALAGGVEDELADVERRMRGVRPLRVLYYDTPGYTMGAGTLVDEMIRRAGGRNTAAEIGVRGPGQIGFEMVIALQPDAIITPRYGGAADRDVARATRDHLAGQPLSDRLGLAGGGRRVHEVPAAWISTVSHHAARGLGRVARLLHPEAFRA